jgi:hypothetical protein
VLWKLLTGKYYRPRDEERIFMFLDLRSSTAIAEQIGHKRFFEFLRELFQDVTRPVVESRGEIYQYVGDEVPVERGLQDANCIACFFRIEQAIAAKGAEYLDRFGVAPAFKAGVHVGEATVGEIGVVKKDIVYSGDVLNTTSRMGKGRAAAPERGGSRRGDRLAAATARAGPPLLVLPCLTSRAPTRGARAGCGAGDRRRAAARLRHSSRAIASRSRSLITAHSPPPDSTR